MFLITQFYEVLLEFLGIVTTPDFPEELRLVWKLRDFTFTHPFL